MDPTENESAETPVVNKSTETHVVNESVESPVNNESTETLRQTENVSEEKPISWKDLVRSYYVTIFKSNFKFISLKCENTTFGVLFCSHVTSSTFS